MNVLIKAQTDGLSDCTIEWIDKALTYLSKHADLNNPEAVKHYIARIQSGNGYKHNLSLAYDKYCRYYQIEWHPTYYKRTSKPIRIPTKEQIEILCASAGKILSLKLCLSKQTGLRPVELCTLKVRDVDRQTRTVYPFTAKYGAPRKLRISESLNARIQAHIVRHSLQPHDKLFNGNAQYYGAKYRQHRNQVADKLNKPELRTIRLYDFRHYFATMLYHKTKDILFVKQQLGHRKLETTLIYTQLLNYDNDEWTCKTASTVVQSKQLIEAGFEYVTEQDGLKLFRKRK